MTIRGACPFTCDSLHVNMPSKPANANADILRALERLVQIPSSAIMPCDALYFARDNYAKCLTTADAGRCLRDRAEPAYQIRKTAYDHNATIVAGQFFVERLETR